MFCFCLFVVVVVVVFFCEVKLMINTGCTPPNRDPVFLHVEEWSILPYYDQISAYQIFSRVYGPNYQIRGNLIGVDQFYFPLTQPKESSTAFGRILQINFSGSGM